MNKTLHIHLPHLCRIACWLIPDRHLTIFLYIYSIVILFSSFHHHHSNWQGDKVHSSVSCRQILDRNLTIIWFSFDYHLMLVYHHLMLVYHHLMLVYHHLMFIWSSSSSSDHHGNWHQLSAIIATDKLHCTFTSSVRCQLIVNFQRNSKKGFLRTSLLHIFTSFVRCQSHPGSSISGFPLHCQPTPAITSNPGCQAVKDFA